jgi:hypothetical protein
MRKLRRKVRTFFARLRFAYVNARRSTKQFKQDGIVFLPNGSVLVDPRRSLSSFGYTTIPTSEADSAIFDEDDVEEDLYEDEDEDFYA